MGIAPKLSIPRIMVNWYAMCWGGGITSNLRPEWAQDIYDGGAAVHRYWLVGGIVGIWFILARGKFADSRARPSNLHCQPIQNCLLGVEAVFGLGEDGVGVGFEGLFVDFFASVGGEAVHD